MQSPKYQSIQNHILDLIKRGELVPGDKAPSENKLAFDFGISRQTARHALTELVAKGVLIRKQGSGTFVNSNARRIGVCMTHLDTYIFPDIIKGIDESLGENNISLVLTGSRNDLLQEKSSIDYLLSQKLDGLIWEPALTADRGADDQLLQRVKQSNLPVVLINSSLPMENAGMVLTEDVEGMAMLTRHLIEKGHRSIGGVFCSDMTQGIRRYKGYRQEIADKSMVFNDDQVIWFKSSELNTCFIKKINDYLNKVIANKITAICCYNDMTAEIVMKCAFEKGLKIPEDFAITGFDAVERLNMLSNSGEVISNNLEDDEQVKPYLTTIKHPCSDLGREAVEQLLSLIGGSKAEILEMPAELVYGLSTL